MPIVIDPNKQVTDPVLLAMLVRQSIDYRYVELYQDYALAYEQGVKVKGKSPYAKFYRHTETNKQWMVASALPMVNADGVKVQVGWDKVGGNYISKVNQFQAVVSDKTVTVTCINDQPTGTKKYNSLTYIPQLYLNGVEQTCGKAILAAIDPTNSNYQNNVLEWDYGICKRRLRLIEGRLLGTWVFATSPDGEVQIKYNQLGAFKLRLGQFSVNDDEEIIPKKVFDDPLKAGLFGYPLTISDSSTFYPDADPETTSVDGRVRRRTDGSGATWSTLRDGAGTAAFDAEASSAPMVFAGYSGYAPNYWYHMDRGVILFDTSGLPDDCIISTGADAPIASMYGVSKVDPQSWAPNINLYGSTPTSNTALVAADYSQVGTTSYCNSPITYAGWSITGYNAFTLNAAGIAAISKTGVTKLGLRNANYDVADVAPSNPTTDRLPSFGAYFAEQGNGYKPKLVVTYTTPLGLKSSTGTRAAIGLNTQISSGLRSGTSTRAKLTLEVVPTLSLRSSSGTRASLVLSTQASFSLRSSSSTRAKLTIEVVPSLSLRSSTSTRASLIPYSSVGIALRSQTSTRASVLLSTISSLAIRSATGTRASLAISSLVSLALRDSVPIRAALSLTISFVIVLELRSSTSTRAAIALNTAVILLLSSRTVTRAALILITISRYQEITMAMQGRNLTVRIPSRVFGMKVRQDG